jgi:predicted XRE-type DNA-binding protein
MKATEIEVHVSKPNIFSDLGLPDAENHFLKAKIAAELYRLVNAEKLTQTVVGQRMGIRQPEVSRLFKGYFREYSVERLIGFLTAFNQDVKNVTRHSQGDGERQEIAFRHEPPER